MCVIVYYGLRICGQKIIICVTVVEKVVTRLDKYDDVIEWNFMKIAPPQKMKSWLRPWCQPKIQQFPFFLIA